MSYLTSIVPRLVRTMDAAHENQSYIFLNPYSYLMLRDNRKLFNSFDGICIDGILLSYLLGLFFGKTERISFDFSSIADEVFRRAEKNEESIFIVGSTENNIKEFIKKIKDRYSEINLIGYRNGYMDEQQKKALIELICDLRPDIVIVGLGSPLQEEFLKDLQVQRKKGKYYTCGGFIHQTAGAKNVDYYPKYINKLNLRWLYRGYKEPKFIIRFLTYYPLFLLTFIYDLFAYRLRH